jgi:hypothetical protein
MPAVDALISAGPFLSGGQTVYLQAGGGMLTNNGETMRQLTLDGLGISRVFIDFLVEKLGPAL